MKKISQGYQHLDLQITVSSIMYHFLIFREKQKELRRKIRAEKRAEKIRRLEEELEEEELAASLPRKLFVERTEAYNKRVKEELSAR